MCDKTLFSFVGIYSSAPSEHVLTLFSWDRGIEIASFGRIVLSSVTETFIVFVGSGSGICLANLWTFMKSSSRYSLAASPICSVLVCNWMSGLLSGAFIVDSFFAWEFYSDCCLKIASLENSIKSWEFYFKTLVALGSSYLLSKYFNLELFFFWILFTTYSMLFFLDSSALEDFSGFWSSGGFLVSHLFCGV